MSVRAVNVGELQPGMVVAEDVIGDSGVLAKKGEQLEGESIEALRSSRISRIKVIVDDGVSPDEGEGEPAGKKAEGVPVAEAPEREQASYLYEMAISVVKEVLDAVRTKRPINVDRVRTIAERIVDGVINRQSVLLSLTGAAEAGDYLPYNAVNVAMLSTAVGSVLGYTDLQLVDVAMGALLHDIGMVNIPPEILNKSGGLTDGERAVIKSHPSDGFKYLAAYPGLSEGTRLIVLQHQEREDGSGYPQGLKRGEIHEYAVLVGIVDIYDALTTKRTYKPSRMTPAEAVDLINKIDPASRVIRAFARYMTRYPIGSFVLLDNGDVGVVVGTDEKNPFRPTVRILYGRYGDAKRPGGVINLVEEPTLRVHEVLTEMEVAADMARTSGKARSVPPRSKPTETPSPPTAEAEVVAPPSRHAPPPPPSGVIPPRPTQPLVIRYDERGKAIIEPPKAEGGPAEGRIAVESLKPGMQFEVPLRYESIRGKILLGASIPLTEGLIRGLKRADIKEVFIGGEAASISIEPTVEEIKSRMGGTPVEDVKEIDDLEVGMELATPIYGDGRLYDIGTVLTKDLIDDLRRWKFTRVKVRDYVTEAEFARRERKKKKDSARYVISQAKHYVNEIIEGAKQGGRINESHVLQAAQRVVDEALIDRNILLALTTLRSPNDPMNTHFINIASFATVAGMMLEYDREDLMILCQAALLHDIGMVFISPNIYDGRSILTPSQYNRMRNHTEYGLQIVEHLGGIDPLIKTVIAQHHERENGRGYPNGLKGKDIHDYAKIVGVADTFNAYASPRIGRRRLSYYDALRTVLSLSPNLFDQRIMRAFLEALSLYPVGSLVRLNTGEVAIVTGTNEEVPFRPILRIVFDEHQTKVDKMIFVDLLEDRSRFITAILNEGDYNLQVFEEF
ncbi:MAG: HD-GYP domain-containing protein [bacterium]